MSNCNVKRGTGASLPLFVFLTHSPSLSLHPPHDNLLHSEFLCDDNETATQSMHDDHLGFKGNRYVPLHFFVFLTFTSPGTMQTWEGDNGAATQPALNGASKHFTNL